MSSNPLVLHDVMMINTNCVRDLLILQQQQQQQEQSRPPTVPPPEWYSSCMDTLSHRLQHAVRMLRNDAAASTVQPSPSSSLTPLVTATGLKTEEKQKYHFQLSLIPTNTVASDMYYCHDRPLLFHLTTITTTTTNVDVKVDDADDDEDNFDDDDDCVMCFVSATILFNMALVAHRRAALSLSFRPTSGTTTTMTQQELWRNVGQLYEVVIALLLDIRTNILLNNHNTNDDLEMTTRNFMMLFVLTHHCLGNVYLELELPNECLDCMMKIQDILLCFDHHHHHRHQLEGFMEEENDENDNDDFDIILDEIKLNMILWKMNEPSPVARAA